MNLVADEGVDAAIVEALRGDGHGVYYVAEQQPGLTDSEVLEQAAQRNAILLTPDKGFGELVFLQHREVPGVLLLRLAGLGLTTKARLATEAVAAHGRELEGSFSVLGPGSIRIRKRE